MRDKHISIAKGIAIILMVVGHSKCPDLLRNFIYQFHMPLFFILSGYFFKDITDFGSGKTFVVKRIKGLWWPYVYWSIPFMLISPYLVGLGYEYGCWDSFHDIVEGIVWIVLMNFSVEALPGFWFLNTLFHASLLVCILSFVCSKLKLATHNIILLLLICAGILSFVKLPFAHMTVFGAVYASLYLMGGYYYKKTEKESFYKAASLLLLFALTFFGAYYYKVCEFLFCDNPNRVITSLLFGVSGTIFTLGISEKIKDFGLFSKILQFVGDNTLVVLALHVPAMRMLNVILVKCLNFPPEHMNELTLPNYNNMLWLTYVIVGCTTPVALKYIYIKSTNAIKRISNKNEQYKDNTQ